MILFNLTRVARTNSGVRCEVHDLLKGRERPLGTCLYGPIQTQRTVLKSTFVTENKPVFCYSD